MLVCFSMAEEPAQVGDSSVARHYLDTSRTEQWHLQPPHQLQASAFIPMCCHGSWDGDARGHSQFYSAPEVVTWA